MSKSELAPIESSMFSHHGYDPDTSTMTVRYKNSSAVYQATDVSMEKHAAFAGNLSPGSYFNSHLRNNHIWRKVSE